MHSLQQDLRYAMRRLFRASGFTAIAVVTIALGMGANSAIFSVVHGVLLQPLPYQEPDRLVALYHCPERYGRRTTMSGPNFWDVRRFSETLSDAAAYSRSRSILTGRGEPVRLDVAEVSVNLFDVLGVAPAHGRTFREDESEPGRTRVAILSDGLWQQRFGGDPAVLGSSITLDGEAVEVVGIMPPGFAFPAARQVWRPIVHDNDFTTEQRDAWYLGAVARMNPGVEVQQVQAEVTAIAQRLAAVYPEDNEGLDFAAVPLHDATVGEIRTAVLVLFVAVGVVLLIACANVANLLLARAAGRTTEMAIRTALGAGRWRLVRQLLTESVMLAMAGGALGLLLAVWGVDALVSLQPQGIPRLDNVRVSGTVMLYTFGLAILTGIVFGLVPAFQATGHRLGASLKEGGRGAVTSRTGARVRASLVVAQMTLAVVLLAGAGLLIRSFIKLQSVDPGFQAAEALTFELSLPDARYAALPQQVAFFDDLLPRLESIPGVSRAGGVVALPLSGTSFVLTFNVDGRPPLPPGQQQAMQVRIATPAFFDAIGIPLRRGRLFDERDREDAPPVVLLTETAAQSFFPGEDAIGRRVSLDWTRDGRRAGGEVVGVLGDTRETGLAEPEPPQIYLPFRQWPVQSMAVVLRTAVPPATVAEAARREVLAVDPDLPVSNVRTIEQLLARSVSQPRFYMTLLAIFAAVALVLAAIGTFGVLSYAVAQRTREIGIRIALGAGRGEVVGLVVRQAMLLAGVGAALGIAAAVFVSRAMASLLFGTSPADPLTLATVALGLLGVALGASCVPALRATRIDPTTALRAE
jgi:putative ABC transport system permease protein